MTRRLHLHIGPRKSGTTYLQHGLVASAALLTSAGLTYPQRDVTGDLGLNHETALLDAATVQPGYRATALRRALHRSDTDVVLSGEAAAGLTPLAAERLLSYLDVAEVHVVITARVISSVLPSTWQQSVRNGRATSFATFLQGVIHEDEERQAAPDSWQEDPAQDFWRSQAIADLAERWLGCASRVSVVTVPARTAAPTVLWQRFLGSLSVDLAHHPELGAVAPIPRHEGVTAGEALLLREVMQQLTQAGLDVDDRGRWARRLVSEVFRNRPDRGSRLTLPEDTQRLAEVWAQRDISLLTAMVAEGRVTLIGDVEDLRVDPSPPAPARTEELAREIADLGGRCVAYLEAAR
jgi:hypothetical protein